MSYGTDLAEYQRTASYVDRILRGANLPISQSSSRTPSS